MNNDYFKLRVELGLANYPDAMVEETGRDVETRILSRDRVTPGDIAWLIEAASRLAPKVRQAVVSDGVRPKEGLG
jgi:hypothetical protein